MNRIKFMGLQTNFASLALPVAMNYCPGMAHVVDGEGNVAEDACGDVFTLTVLFFTVAWFVESAGDE